MIIDFRVRPPFGGFKNSWLYNTAGTSVWAKRFNLPLSAAAKQFSMELCLQEMEEADIVKGVVPIRRSENIDNKDLVQLLSDYPDKFVGMIGIDPLEGEKSIEMIDEYINNGPCQGIIIEPGYCQEPLLVNDERIFNVYEKCQKDDILLLMSYGGLTAPNQSYTMPIYIDNVAETFPKLNMLICHAAWPWVTQMCHVALLRNNVYIMPDIYAVRTPGAVDYIAAANYMITEKFIYGSAFPAVSMKEMAEYYKAVLRPEVIDDVMYNNAAKLLKMQ